MLKSRHNWRERLVNRAHRRREKREKGTVRLSPFARAAYPLPLFAAGHRPGTADGPVPACIPEILLIPAASIRPAFTSGQKRCAFYAIADRRIRVCDIKVERVRGEVQMQ